ncbi:unnamed protein product [Coregonus sp. 'balchen']|nr:unnamed protein product [Coregonus sp. 'balchen']
MKRERSCKVLDYRQDEGGGDTLGRGHFAVVKLARHVFTGEKEVRCMKLVQHPNVVRLYEVIDTQTKLYLILELGDGGDMYDCIMKHDGGLTEEVAKRYFAQIVHAISYCHQLHVVHRDLKPENVVFFEKQGLVKLTDFGFSNKFQPGENLATSCGSLAYSAPEILLGDEYDAPAVDIWSLGVILFMLVCGHPPFQEANDSETLTMIMDCKYTVPSHISSACRDLIDCMLQRDPKRRATVELIQGHDWLQGVDPSPATKLTTPLVSYRSLSEEEHSSIIQRMALGGIADRDTVTEQSWPTRVDVHQDMGDGLGGTPISHPGGPQSPARSAESLVHHGPRPKTSLLELNHRRLDNNTHPTHTLTLQADDTHTTHKALPSTLPPVGSSREHQDRGLRPPKDDKEKKEGKIEGKKCGFKPEQAFLSLHTGLLTLSGVSSPATVTKVATVAMASPTSERRDDNDSVSQLGQRRPDRDTTGPRQGRPSFACGGGDRGGSGGDRGGSGGDRGRESPSADGSGMGAGLGVCGSAKAASGLVESLKLMSLCLSSQFHSLTGGGGGVRGGSLDHQDQPVWRMCMGGSTGSLDKVSLLGGPSPGGTHHLQHHPLDHLSDPQFEAPSLGTLRLSELDLAREHHRNLKNRVLQMPLSDKTMSVNIHRSPKEGLLCPPSPHSCCQVI